MLKTAIWLLLSASFVFAGVVQAKVIPEATYGSVTIATPLSIKGGEKSLQATDEVIFYEDFETGATGWTYVDLMDVDVWHTDDYNAWGGSGMSWWCGDSALGGYADHWMQFLVTPTLDLSGTTNPQLQFKLFYASEEDFDGGNIWVSTDDGLTWEVLNTVIPAYESASLPAFVSEFGLGANVPGWMGYSGGISPGAWIDASADLSSYAGTVAFKLRFAFGTDGGWSTADDPTLTGMYVDEILIGEAPATVLLRNNAEGIAIPSDLVPTPFPAPGNFWHVSEVISPPPPSPTHVMEMSDGAGSYVPYIFNAAVTPTIDLTTYNPDSGRVYGDLYVRGGIDVNLNDWWTVQVSPDNGISWYFSSNPWGDPFGQNFVFIDAPPDWSLWSAVYSEGGMELTDYAGYEILVRLLFFANPDTVFGEGVFIDDLQIDYITGLDHDVATQKLHVPMPTSAYFNTISCTVEVLNLGLLDEPLVQTWFRVDGTPTPLLPWSSIASDSVQVRTHDWTVPGQGAYIIDAYTTLASDQDLSNDTSYAGLVEVTPDTIFELGYDNRQYSYDANLYYWTWDVGEGPYIRFTPADDGIGFDMDGLTLKAMFDLPGTIRVHILEGGSPTEPGAEVAQFDGAVSMPYPNWQTFDISGIPYLQNSLTDFWVWFEMIDVGGVPSIIGSDGVHGEGHMFADFGAGIEPSEFDFFARAVFTGQGVTGIGHSGKSSQPNDFSLYQNSPNPFNPTTTITFSLDKAGSANVKVFDLMGRTVRVLADRNFNAGTHSLNFEAGGLSSGIYIYRLEADGKSLQNKMVLLK